MRKRKVHIIDDEDTGRYFCEGPWYGRGEFATSESRHRKPSCKLCLAKRKKRAKK